MARVEAEGFDLKKKLNSNFFLRSKPSASTRAIILWWLNQAIFEKMPQKRQLAPLVPKPEFGPFCPENGWSLSEIQSPPNSTLVIFGVSWPPSCRSQEGEDVFWLDAPPWAVACENSQKNWCFFNENAHGSGFWFKRFARGLALTKTTTMTSTTTTTMTMAMTTTILQSSNCFQLIYKDCAI